MRFIVEQKQTVFSRNTMFLSGWALRSRLTRLSSVPIAQDDPAGAASMVSMMNSVDPTYGHLVEANMAVAVAKY